MDTEAIRRLLVRWIYAAIGVHLVVGIFLPWINNIAIFDAYHRSIEVSFWGHEAPASARAQQLWWISLFGPTVQSVALWMGALVRIGDRHRSAFAWSWLIIGLAVWAPQDMLISLRANCRAHVWLDCFAVITMCPPLIWLWLHDRKKIEAPN